MIVAVEEGTEVLSTLTLVGKESPARCDAPPCPGGDIRNPQPRPRTILCRITVIGSLLLGLPSTRRTTLVSYRMHVDEKRHFLDSQIVNNCLSLAKSFGLRISTRLGRSCPCAARPRTDEGYRDGRPPRRDFEVNFDVPEGLALGKSVAKGFGAIERVG